MSALFQSIGVSFCLRAIRHGSLIWTYETPNFVSLPAITANHLYVITRENGQAQLRALSQQTGQSVWHTNQAHFANAAPVVAGNQVFVKMSNGQIVAYAEE